MNIVFYCKESAPANIENYIELGVSGTVSAMILASYGLSQLGHSVVVLNKSETGTFQGTRHIHTISPSDVARHLEEVGQVDVFIANGWAGDIFLKIGVNVATKVHWVHNFVNQVPIESGIATGKINYVVCISLNQLGTWWQSRAFPRVTNIPNCVDTSSLQGMGVRNNLKNKIMFIGATRESKGFHDALRVFRKFHAAHPAYRFYVAGGANLHGSASKLSANGIFEQEYEDRCLKEDLYDSNGDLRDEIVLLGRIPRKEVLEHLLTAKVALVNPSWTSEPETYCVSAVEAQGMGVPVVSTFRGGLPEVVKDGVSGILSKNRTDQTLVTAIERLTQDDRLAADFSLAGRRNVVENFGVSKIANEWDAKLRVMVAGKPFKGNLWKAVRIKIRHKLRI